MQHNTRITFFQVDVSRGPTMKTGIALIALTLAVAGCGHRQADAWYARKAQCVDGDFQVCSEIGHQARAAMGGTTVQQQTPAAPAAATYQAPYTAPMAPAPQTSEHWVLSTPIVD